MRRVNVLIRDQLSRILERDVELPRGTICTVTNVSTARDLRTTCAWVSILPASSREAVLDLLVERHADIQRSLGSSVKLRYVPTISFQLDKREDHADRINTLLDEIRPRD